VAVMAVQCPECGSTEVVRYGRQANGEQRYRCNNVDCKRRIFLARYWLIPGGCRRSNGRSWTWRSMGVISAIPPACWESAPRPSSQY